MSVFYLRQFARHNVHDWTGKRECKGDADYACAGPVAQLRRCEEERWRNEKLRGTNGDDDDPALNNAPKPSGAQHNGIDHKREVSQEGLKPLLDAATTDVRMFSIEYPFPYRWQKSLTEISTRGSF